MNDRTFEFSNFLLARTPLFPFAELERLHADHGGGSDPAPEGEIRTRLQSLVLRGDIREAIFHASRTLHERIGEWDPSQLDSRSLKTQHALYKYFARMTYRCTPFGLFAGVSWCATVSASEQNGRASGIRLMDRRAYRKHARIDAGAMMGIIEHLQESVDIRRGCAYVINPTLHRRGSRWQYFESHLHGGRRIFELSYLECSDYLDELLIGLAVSPEPVPFEVLAQRLRTLAPTASSEECIEFLDELVTGSVILSTLELRITGLDPLTRLVRECQGLQAAGIGTALDRLVGIQQELAAFSIGEVGSALSPVLDVESGISELTGEAKAKDLLQIDLEKPVQSVRIDRPLIESLEEVAELLMALSNGEADVFKTFKNQFIDRYDQQEVPLLEVLSPDSGLSFGRQGSDPLPLLEGLPKFEGRGYEPAVTRHSPATELMFRLFEESCRSGAEEVRISDEDSRELIERARGPMPSSFGLTVSVLAHSDDAEGARPRMFVRSASGPSGANTIGRFCYMDPALESATADYLSREAGNTYPDAIVAEIVHLPMDRLGNVILRPALRSYEIPICGLGSVPSDHQILLKDLNLLVRDDRIHLIWTRTGQRVLPRLTSAHNFHAAGNVSIYQFLGMLQTQEECIQPYYWPALLQKASRLPRVTYRNCVLCPQQWTLSARQLKQIGQSGREKDAEMIESWRRSLNWPDVIELVEGDNCLPIHLDNPVAVDCLANELADRVTATIREALVPQSGFVSGPEGEFCHEVVLPFVRKGDTDATAKVVKVTPKAPEAPRPFRTELSSTARYPYGPGSEWLYLKLYSGTEGAERILSEHLSRAIATLKERDLLGKWFFLRYADPEHHLRVRFHGDPQVLASKVLPLLREEMCNISRNSLAWKFESGTYEPETDRYGGPEALDLSEQMFRADSECAIELIAGNTIGHPDLRWKALAASVDRFWQDFGFDVDARIGFYAEVAAGFQRRYGTDRSVKVVIDRRFREIKGDLDQCIISANGMPDAIAAPLARRSRALAPLIDRIRNLANSPSGLTRPLSSIAISHVHMAVNRLCISSSNPQEFIVYELLHRLHKAARARNREPKAMSAG